MDIKDIVKEENLVYKKTSLMTGSDALIYLVEKYFKSIRQITFEGDAEKGFPFNLYRR